MNLESRERPTVLLATDDFAHLARQVATSYGLADARIAAFEHPLGGIGEDAVRSRASAVVEAVVEVLTASP